jgi:CHAT domain-containing protein
VQNEGRLQQQLNEARARSDSKTSADRAPLLQTLAEAFGARGNLVFRERSLYSLATYLYDSNRFSESTRTLDLVLRLAEEHKWYYYWETARSQMASNLSRAGEDSEAIRYCSQGVNSQATPYFEAKRSQYIGMACWHVGDLDHALHHFRESIQTLIQKDPRRGDLAYDYLNVADIYRLKGSHRLARLYSDTALNLAQEAKESDLIAQSASFSAIEMSILGESGIAHDRMQLTFDSLNNEALGQRRFTDPLAYIRAASIALQQGSAQESLKYYAKAQQALEWPESDVTLRIDALRGKARTLLSLGRTTEARPELLKAVDLIDHQRGRIAEGENRNHYLDATRGVFDQMIVLDTQYQSGMEAEAFDWSERSRARTLFDEISFRSKKGESGASSNRDLKDTAQTLGLKDVQKALPPDLTLLEFAVTDQGTTIFVITKLGMAAKPCSATSAELQRLVSEYVGLISEAAPIEDITEKGKKLYDLLVSPVKADLRDKAKVCIIPDESLHFLPFCSLVDPQGDYLVDAHSLTYAPSASVLINCLRDDDRRAGQTPEKVVVVGNPAYDTGRFAELRSLPESEDEADRIAGLYPGALLLTRANATVQRLRSAIKDSDVAHLALHSITDEAFPGKVGLILAKDSSESASSGLGKAATLGGEDMGVWFLNEIYGVKLPRTRLVVISSCESGVGEYYKGEGIVSLVYPFIVAGAPSVVASLWSVQSEPTSNLMYQFHVSRQNDKAATGDALRAAQLKMAHGERYNHPFYWAAFVAVGAAEHR